MVLPGETFINQNTEVFNINFRLKHIYIAHRQIYKVLAGNHVTYVEDEK